MMLIFKQSVLIFEVDDKHNIIKDSLAELRTLDNFDWTLNPQLRI